MNVNYRLRPEQPPATHRPPLLILLHGKGANEDDLFALTRFFDPRLRILSLRAPHEMAPGYYRWYEREDSPQGSIFDIKEIQLSLSWLQETLPELLRQHQSDPANLHLFGFSQGAAMALALASTDAVRVRSVVSIAGRMLPGLPVCPEAAEHAARPAIFLQHGGMDDLVPAEESRTAREQFAAQGFRTELREYPGCAHTISPAMLKDALAFHRLILNQDQAHS